jgi:DNA-binding PadR family transcriptional regulator
MLAIARGGRQAYALAIQEEMEAAGHGLTLGVLYTVLSRLERHQLVRHRDGEGTPERGERPKRFYSLTGVGVRELQGALRVLDSLRSGSYSPQGA